jgi:hypothetical protein
VQQRELLKTARLLASQGRKPRQSDLRRAVSTAYYALYHALARCCADRLVGGDNSNRSEAAWLQVYRSLDHRQVKQACEKTAMMTKFPKGIQDFADKFVQMQEKRHTADYDPSARVLRSDVNNDIGIVEATIAGFESVAQKDKTAFAAYVLFKRR